ncbi:MAG: hypothetical protein PHI42_05505 [Paludibacteraceae bacterium]|nr:hypothetical protein [Paludibacteraceae bacterium]
MNQLVKYLGVVFVLIGVIVLVLHSLVPNPTNVYLWLGLVFMVAGIITHIFMQKRFK